VWANRILEKDRLKCTSELEILKFELQNESQKDKKHSPRFSSSLSSSSGTIFDKIGDSGPPWGVPSLVGCSRPPIMTPQFKKLRMSFNTRLSLIRVARRANRRLMIHPNTQRAGVVEGVLHAHTLDGRVCLIAAFSVGIDQMGAAGQRDI